MFRNDGRIGRATFARRIGIVAVVWIVWVTAVQLTNRIDLGSDWFGGMMLLAMVVLVLWSALVVIIAIAARLHDTGRSGWWAVIAISGIGILVLTVWLLSDGQPAPNRYGPDPHAPEVVPHMPAPPRYDAAP